MADDGSQYINPALNITTAPGQTFGGDIGLGNYNINTPVGGSSATNTPPPPAVVPTPPSTTPQIIQTGSDARTNATTQSQTLDQLLAQYNNVPAAPTDTNVDSNYQDSFTRALDAMGARADAGTKAIISGIQAQAQNNENKTNQQYRAYQAGLQQLGLEEGKVQMTPEVVAGQHMQAFNDNQQKILSIEAAENKAVQEAQTARDNQDFKTLTDKMNYIKGLQAAKQTELTNYYNRLISGGKIAANIAPGLYDSFSKLSPQDQVTALQTISSRYGIPLGDLTSALANYKLSSAKTEAGIEHTRELTSKSAKAGSTKNYTATNIPSDISSQLQYDLEHNGGSKSLSDFVNAYPEVSTSYLNSLYNQIGL